MLFRSYRNTCYRLSSDLYRPAGHIAQLSPARPIAVLCSKLLNNVSMVVDGADLLCFRRRFRYYPCIRGIILEVK